MGQRLFVCGVCRVGQNTVYLVIFVPDIPYIHRVCPGFIRWQLRRNYRRGHTKRNYDARL